VAPVTKKQEYTGDYPEKTLYIPGPTEVREDVIDEMAQPMFGHRMDRMTDLYTTIVEDTKERSNPRTSARNSKRATSTTTSSPA